MKYLVTGGAGFIGSHIVDALLSQGHEVIAIDNFISGKRENISHIDSTHFTLVQGSITDGKLLALMLEGVDGIFHQAALPSVPRSIHDPLSTHDCNATGTLQLLWQAHLAKVPRVVFASSSSVYGDNPTLPKKEEDTGKVLSPYALTKKVGEDYMRLFHELYGMQTISLRYFNVFGPRQDPNSPYAAVIPKFISLMLEGKQPEIYGNGEQSRDFTYVDNVVLANLLAMNTTLKHGVFNIAGGDSHTLNSLMQALNHLLGTQILPIYLTPRKGDILHSKADIHQAEKFLLYKPTLTFEEGIKKTVEWHRPTF